MAGQPLITPTRRRALGFSAAALLAGWRGPVLVSAQAAEPGPDAELISLCAHLVTVEAGLEAIITTRKTLADEARVQPALDALYDQQGRIFARLESVPPVTTPAGTQALARASLAIAPRNTDRSIIYAGDAEWLAFSALECLAGGFDSMTAAPGPG